MIVFGQVPVRALVFVRGGLGNTTCLARLQPPKSEGNRRTPQPAMLQ